LSGRTGGGVGSRGGKAKSITDLAEHEGVTVAFVCRLLPLTCLAPAIVEAILDGRPAKGRCLGVGHSFGKSRAV